MIYINSSSSTIIILTMQYQIHTHLEIILHMHAPLKTLIFQQRKLNSWWTTKLSEMHRKLRKKDMD